MWRQLRTTVGNLPPVGTLRLYDDATPCQLPGERLVAADGDWIVEPAPGRRAALARVGWWMAGRWVYGCVIVYLRGTLEPVEPVRFERRLRRVR